MAEKYGKTREEIDTEKMIVCRDIVKEILNFGVNEDQKLQVIKLLSLELENNNAMKRISSLVKEIKSGKENTEKEQKLLDF